MRRDADGRCVPGERLAALGRNVRVPLHAAAVPELTAMAEDLGMTAFLVVRLDDEVITIESIEPRTTAAHVAYRPGSRHSIDRGAPGLAMLAGAVACVFLAGIEIDANATGVRVMAAAHAVTRAVGGPPPPVIPNARSRADE